MHKLSAGGVRVDKFTAGGDIMSWGSVVVLEWSFLCEEGSCSLCAICRANNFYFANNSAGSCAVIAGDETDVIE